MHRVVRQMIGWQLSNISYKRDGGRLRSDTPLFFISHCYISYIYGSREQIHPTNLSCWGTTVLLLELDSSCGCRRLLDLNVGVEGTAHTTNCHHIETWKQWKTVLKHQKKKKKKKDKRTPSPFEGAVNTPSTILDEYIAQEADLMLSARRGKKIVPKRGILIE